MTAEGELELLLWTLQHDLDLWLCRICLSDWLSHFSCQCVFSHGTREGLELAYVLVCAAGLLSFSFPIGHLTFLHR